MISSLKILWVTFAVTGLECLYFVYPFTTPPILFQFVSPISTPNYVQYIFIHQVIFVFFMSYFLCAHSTNDLALCAWSGYHFTNRQTGRQTWSSMGLPLKKYFAYHDSWFERPSNSRNWHPTHFFSSLFLYNLFTHISE